MEKKQKEQKKKLNIILQKKAEEKLRLELAKKQAEKQRQDELQKQLEEDIKKRKITEELNKKIRQQKEKQMALKKAKEEERQRKIAEQKKKLEEQRKRREELNRKKIQQEQLTQLNNYDNLSREERLKQKVEEYKKQKEREAWIVSWWTMLEMKIREEKRIINELEQRLEYHKTFLREYEDELRKKQASNDIFSLTEDEKKLLEDYRRKKREALKNNIEETQTEKKYTKESYIPNLGFYKKENWIILCNWDKKLDIANYSTFKELGDNYAKDILRVYYDCKTIKTWDVGDFKIIKYGFAKDKNNVYYRWKKVNVYDPKTFWIESKWNFKIAYDKDNVYLFDAFDIRRVLKNTHFDDVEYLDKIYFKSKNKIITIKCDTTQCYFHDLKQADYNTFKALVFGFAKDKNNVYYKWVEVSNLDPNSIVPISYTKVKDKNWNYKLVWKKFIKY